jgi:hypothetical protein
LPLEVFRLRGGAGRSWKAAVRGVELEVATFARHPMAVAIEVAIGFQKRKIAVPRGSCIDFLKQFDIFRAHHIDRTSRVGRCAAFTTTPI